MIEDGGPFSRSLAPSPSAHSPRLTDSDVAHDRRNSLTMAHPYKPPLQFNAIHSAVYHRAVVSSPSQRKAPRNGGAEVNGDMKKGPTEQGRSHNACRRFACGSQRRL
jgi:hypothetical protein